MQGVKRYEVILLAHDEAWDKEFQEVKRMIEILWKDNVLEVEHIGSTAIKNIVAKPILDIAVVLKSFNDMSIAALQNKGYDYCGLEKPDNDRHLFVLRGESEISLHHIHCYEANNLGYKKCIFFRDYLNSHPEKAFEYSELKKRLASEYAFDRVSYTNAKTDFINSIYNKMNN